MSVSSSYLPPPMPCRKVSPTQHAGRYIVVVRARVRILIPWRSSSSQRGAACSGSTSGRGSDNSMSLPQRRSQPGRGQPGKKPFPPGLSRAPRSRTGPRTSRRPGQVRHGMDAAADAVLPSDIPARPGCRWHENGADRRSRWQANQANGSVWHSSLSGTSKLWHPQRRSQVRRAAASRSPSRGVRRTLLDHVLPEARQHRHEGPGFASTARSAPAK